MQTDRSRAEQLWDIMDKIDSYTDLMDLSNPNHLKSFYDYVNEQIAKRHEILKSDGYKLYTPEEFYTEVSDKGTPNKLSIKNQTIWKYILKPDRIQTLELPSESTILSTSVENGHVCIWVRVNPDDKNREERCIEVIETGWNFSDNVQRIFLGTVQLRSLVFHIFERV